MHGQFSKPFNFLLNPECRPGIHPQLELAHMVVSAAAYLSRSRSDGTHQPPTIYRTVAGRPGLFCYTERFPASITILPPTVTVAWVMDAHQSRSARFLPPLS